jgi:predicted ATPase
MISNLIVKNFKSIGEEGVKVDLRPLTIFLGQNGSGKSSILEAIGILSQSAEATNFKTDGNLVKIPLASNVFYKKNSEYWLTLEVHTNSTHAEINRLIKISNNMLTDDIQTALHKGDIGYKLSYKLGTGEFSQSVMIGKHEIARTGYIKVGESSWTNKLELSNKSIYSQESADKILDERIFAPRDKPEEGYPFSDIAKEIVKIIKARINKAFLISAMRGSTEFEKTLDQSLKEKSLKVLGVGTYGQNLIPVLALTSNRENEEIHKKIDKWASEFGLKKFSAGWKGGYTLGSDYVDDKLNSVLNLAMASHGSKQILSVITQLFWSDPGSIIMIEEPEISLHPNAQARLAELFAEAIHEGKQIIITTHSEFLPLTLSIPIQNRLLKKDDIAIYHVEKGQKGTAVKRLELTSKGYVKGWIPSFAELESQLLKDWMETVPEV